MKKILFLLLMLCPVLSMLAAEVPTVLTLTTTSGEVQIPIATIKKITYDSDGKTMQVLTTTGETDYQVANISQMTLNNNAEMATENQIDATSAEPFTKIVQNGVVYIVKDGKIYTLKGEKL